MLMLQKGINWNDLETTKKRGCCCIRTISDGWTIDDEIPIFTKDRDYIERLIHFESEQYFNMNRNEDLRECPFCKKNKLKVETKRKHAGYNGLDYSVYSTISF